MKKIFFILLIIIGLYGCTAQTCQTRCDNIKPGENVPPFSEQSDLPTGCYYGSLDQKAPGTPAGWVHSGEGTRSAVWCSPNQDTIEACDC